MLISYKKYVSAEKDLGSAIEHFTSPPEN